MSGTSPTAAVTRPSTSTSRGCAASSASRRHSRGTCARSTVSACGSSTQTAVETKTKGWKGVEDIRWTVAKPGEDPPEGGIHGGRCDPDGGGHLLYFSWLLS